jgi:hypothetical protein
MDGSAVGVAQAGAHPASAAAAALTEAGFALVRAPAMRQILSAAGLSDWDGFAASWDALGQDLYMADGGRYRSRRFAAFSVSAGGITRKPHQPHYQSRDYNRLNGGVARWFEPVTDPIGAHPATQAIIGTCDELFSQLTPAERRPRAWHVELHQFRIVASPEAEGRPTPEGMHRDGVDWVLVLLVRRENVASGETRITDGTGAPLGSFTLTEPMDAALVDDRRVQHGVTAIHPLDPARPAWRDVLVLTFRYE